LDKLKNLYLKKIQTDEELFHYHRITKSEIFDSKPDIIYDPNHPSIKDSKNSLYVFYQLDEIIGASMIAHYDDDISILRLIAIDARLQNQGYGHYLLKLIEQLIKDKSYKKILLHARPKAYNFYIKNGYMNMDLSFDPLTFADSIDMGKIF
jgi:ribosomal protein S18 acetylase RimI-like enzyme